ncbi:MAG: DUF488 family protein [Nitrososphaerales archaeon]
MALNIAILQKAHRKDITFLYAAKDKERNNAVVIRDFMLELVT